MGTVPFEYDLVDSREQYELNFSKTQRIEAERRKLKQRLESANDQVIELEVKLHVSKRWLPCDDQYMEVAKYSDLREYHRALDHLQKLVVQRLFELQKLNIAQTGKYHCSMTVTSILM